MNYWILTVTVVGLALAGCTTDSKPKAKAQPVQGGSSSAIVLTDSVLIVGNVAHPVVPWKSGLTLSRALTMAGYRNTGNKARAGVVRKGQQTMFIEIAELFQGQDVVLEAGDRIEIQQ